MKSATGVFIQPIHDASTQRLPHSARIAQAVREAVASGAVAQGERLPSARQLAQDWRVSRGAVDEAFAQLQLEGLIERHVGDGTYLSRSARALAAAPTRGAAPQARNVLARSLLHGSPIAQLEAAQRPLRVPPLHPRSTDLQGFPSDIWRRLLLAAHDDTQRDLLEAGPVGGLPALRAAIAHHLAICRGVQCRPEQVLVTNGPGEGMQLVGRLLLQRGDTVCIEDPGHPSLPHLMQSMGLPVQGVPLDREGYDVAAARRLAPDARLCYLQTLTQYPLGVRTSRQRCMELLDWAEQQGGWIVEGTLNDEWVPVAQQAPALITLDRSARALLLGTFEGIAFPALRVGYIVLPLAIAADFCAAAQAYADHVSAIVQWALAAFIERGHMSAHLQQQRARLARHRELLQRVLLPQLPPGVRAGPLHSGGHVCLHLPDGVRDVEVMALLRRHRLFVESLTQLSWQPAAQPALNGLVLGYAGLDEAALEQALLVVVQTLHAACTGQGGVAAAASNSPASPTSPTSR